LPEKTDRKMPIGPPFWGRPPARRVQTGPFNKQQRQLRLVLTGFRVAKIAAAATMALLIVMMI